MRTTPTGVPAQLPPTVSRSPMTHLPKLIAELFNPGEVPDEVSERLRYEGFIRVDAKGLFGVDRFVMPDRIDHVTQDGVYLKVAEASKLPKV